MNNPAPLQDDSLVDQRGRVVKRMQIPRFFPGAGEPQITSATAMNRLVKSVNALMNARIMRGGSDDIIITDSNFVLQLAVDGTGQIPVAPINNDVPTTIFNIAGFFAATSSGAGWEDSTLTYIVCDVSQTANSSTINAGTVTFTFLDAVGNSYMYSGSVLATNGSFGPTPGHGYALIGPFAPRTFTGPRVSGSNLVPYTANVSCSYSGGTSGGNHFLASSGSQNAFSLSPVLCVTLPGADSGDSGSIYYVIPAPTLTPGVILYTSSTSEILWSGHTGGGQPWQLRANGGGAFPSGNIYNFPADSPPDPGDPTGSWTPNPGPGSNATLAAGPC